MAVKFYEISCNSMKSHVILWNPMKNFMKSYEIPLNCMKFYEVGAWAQVKNPICAIPDVFFILNLSLERL